jgi:hypothetical protein
VARGLRRVLWRVGCCGASSVASPPQLDQFRHFDEAARLGFLRGPERIRRRLHGPAVFMNVPSKAASMNGAGPDLDRIRRGKFVRHAFPFLVFWCVARKNPRCIVSRNAESFNGQAIAAMLDQLSPGEPLIQH